MNLFSLLGLALKSDEIIEILEHYEISVVYDFDRLHENIPDVYWASFHEAGFELRFNERQALAAIFMYVQPREDFKSIEPGLAGVPFYRSFADAKTAFQSAGVPFRTPANGEGWIKGDRGDHTVHHEFNREGELSLVTVMAAVA